MLMINSDFREAHTIKHWDRNTFVSNIRDRNENESVRERKQGEMCIDVMVQFMRQFYLVSHSLLTRNVSFDESESIVIRR
jgi:hypothetical protein